MNLEKIYDICFVARLERNDKKGQLEFAKLCHKHWKTIFVGEIVSGRLSISLGI